MPKKSENVRFFSPIPEFQGQIGVIIPKIRIIIKKRLYAGPIPFIVPAVILIVQVIPILGTRPVSHEFDPVHRVFGQTVFPRPARKTKAFRCLIIAEFDFLSLQLRRTPSYE